MPLSIRIPSEKEAMIREAAIRVGKSKTAFILEAIDEKQGLLKNRQEVIRELSGWLTQRGS